MNLNIMCYEELLVLFVTVYPFYLFVLFRFVLSSHFAPIEIKPCVYAYVAVFVFVFVSISMRVFHLLFALHQRVCEWNVHVQ